MSPKAATITPMYAQGYGTTSPFQYSWGGVTWSIPTGRIYHEIKGDGLRVTNELVNWTMISPTSAQICNYQWQFQNRYGSTIYSTLRSTLFSGCRVGYLPNYNWTTDRTVKTGLLCARLFVNGTYRGEQCHNVYP